MDASILLVVAMCFTEAVIIDYHTLEQHKCNSACSAGCIEWGQFITNSIHTANYIG